MFWVFYFSELDSVDLKFLNGCQVKWGRFTGPAWRTSKTLAEKHDFQEMMLSIFAWRCSFHLCMKVFQRLIYINYSEDEDSANPNCSAMGEETLKRRWWNFTLGGSIIHSFKQTCLRSNQANTQAQLETLDRLLTHERQQNHLHAKHSHSSLTEGGWASENVLL